jgi:glutaredoxin-like protein
MLRDEDKKEIAERFNGLKEPVKLLFFTQKLAGSCQYCTETEQLLREVSDLSENLTLEIANFVTDKEKVETYKIDKIPATVIQGSKDYGIRFYGIPTGYEFDSFLEAILRVSSEESGLSEPIKEKLKSLIKPVHIQIFVTPTCPYCTRAAMTAYQLAIENEFITADIVEVSEFPYLAQKYSVMGVPKVVLNENRTFEGALPEQTFVEHVINSIQ